MRELGKQKGLSSCPSKPRDLGSKNNAQVLWFEYEMNESKESIYLNIKCTVHLDKSAYV
jgi:hypothetical protein